MDDVINSYICDFMQALKDVATGDGAMVDYCVRIITDSYHDIVMKKF